MAGPGSDIESVAGPLTGNTFGIPETETVDEKIERTLALIPMSFQVLNESLATIARLRAVPGVAQREAIENAERKALGMAP